MGVFPFSLEKILLVGADSVMQMIGHNFISLPYRLDIYMFIDVSSLFKDS